MPIDTTVPASSTTGTSGSTEAGGSTGATEGGTGAEVFGDGATEAASTTGATTSTGGTEGTSGTDDGSWDDIANIFGDDADVVVTDDDSGSTIPETPEEEPAETKETRRTNTGSDHSSRLASLINKPLSLPKANDFFNDLFDKMQEAFDKLKEKGGKEAKEDAKKTLKETLNNANILKGKLLGELDKAAKEGKSSVVEAYQEMLQQIEDMRASILENMRLDLGDGAKKAFNEAKEVAKNLGNLLNGEKNPKGEAPQGQAKPSNPDGTKLGYKSPGSKVANSMPQPDLSPEEQARKLAEETKTKDPKNPEFLKKVADKVALLVGSNEAKEREEKKKKSDVLRSKLASITQGILNHKKAAEGAVGGMLRSLLGQSFENVMKGNHFAGVARFIGLDPEDIENEAAQEALVQAGVLKPRGSKTSALISEKPIPTDPDKVDALKHEMTHRYSGWEQPEFVGDFGIPTEEESNTSTIGNLLVTEDLESVVI